MAAGEEAREVAHVKATLQLDTSEARAKLKRDLQVSGNESGREFTRTFKSASGDTRLSIGIDDASVVRAGRKAKDTIERQTPAKLRIEVADKLLAKAKADVEQTSQAIARARTLEADAAGSVRVQELRLNELRDKSRTKASALASAEERLASGHRRLAEAQSLLNRANTEHGSAQEGLTRINDARDLLPDPRSITSAITRVGAEAGATWTRVFSGSITGAVSSPVVGPVIVGALVTAAAAAAPLAGAVLGAGILGGLAAAGIGSGIALQLQDPEVKFAGLTLVNDLKSGLVSASSGMKAPLLAAMDSFGQRIDAQLPAFQRMFDRAGQYLTPLGDALGQAFDNVMPGLESSLAKSAPVIAQIAQSIPEIGSAIGDAFNTLGDHSNDIALGIKVVSDVTTKAIQFAANGVAVLADGVHDVLGFVANIEDLIGSIEDPNGWFSKISSLGGLLDPSGQDAKAGSDEGSKKWRARADAIRAYLDESNRTNESAAAFTRTQVEAAPAVSKFSTTIAEAGVQFAKLADEAKTPSERINALITVGKQFAGSVGESGTLARQFAGALINEGLAASSAVDRVTALKAAQEILNGTNRAAIDATESFNSALAGMTLATDTVATAEATRAAAQKSHAAGVASALKQVPTAEATLADAQERARTTQLGITQARKEYAQQLKDMKESVSDLANSEEGASISLARARENLIKVNADSKASALDRRQAALDVKVAEDSLSDTQANRAAKAKELADAEKAGVNGSPGVVAAQRSQKDALDAVKVASDGVKDALKAVSDAQSATEGSTTKTTASLSTHTVAGIQNRDMLQGLIKSNEDSYFASIANGKSVEWAKAKYDKQAVAIENTAVKAGFNRGEVKKLNKEYGGIPETKQTTFSDGGTFATVWNNLIKLKWMQDNLDQGWTPAQAAQHWTAYTNGGNAGGVSSVGNQQIVVPKRPPGFIGPVQGNATGGYIRGPGGPTGDQIPAWLSDREFVQPAHAVDYYGADTMEALRKRQIPRERLTGDGPGIPFNVSAKNTLIPSVATSGGLSAFGGTPGEAYNTAAGMKASNKVMLALFETGLVESTMRNLASRAVPASLRYPHEGVAAGDHDSVGFLQQRASWGSVKSRMDVADSTRRFVNKAQARESKFDSAGALAQAVQVSAYPTRYNAREKEAAALLARVRGATGGGGGLGAGTGEGGWRWQVAVLNKAGFNFHPSKGQTTGGGHATNSYHYLGRAVDLSPPTMAAFNYIAGTFGRNTKELIYGPAGKRSIRNGQPFKYSSGTLADHFDHIHWAFKDGGLVNLKPGIRRQLNKEKENAVRKAASGRGLTARENEILRSMSAADVSAVYRGLTSKQFAGVYARFNAGEKLALETYQTSQLVKSVPGLAPSEEAAIVDAVNGGTITAAHKTAIGRLTYDDITNLTRKLPSGSLNRLRPFLTEAQRADLDTTRGQRNEYSTIRRGLPSATRTAIAHSAEGKRLSKSEKALLGGLSSSQIAAYHDTMSGKEWRSFEQDLTPTQRRDANRVLAGDVQERNKAIKGARPVSPTANPTMNSINALASQINSLIAATSSSQPVVNFNGNIGSSVDYNAAFQQAAFYARGMG